MDAQGRIEVIGGPPPLSLEALRAHIVACLEGGAVERAILFGSWARGEADIASDVDLVLIESTTQPFVERGRRHPGLFELGPGADLLAYTPEEFERLRDLGSPLVDRVVREGITVYARPER